MPAPGARRVAPAGDTSRKMADAINQHAEMISYGVLQPRTVAELADEDAVQGRMLDRKSVV